MVAQMTLDHFVWVRVLVPEPFFYPGAIFLRRYGQEAKTSPSQGEITGSIPVSATKWQIIKHKIKGSKADALELSLFYAILHFKIFNACLWCFVTAAGVIFCLAAVLQ